MYTVLHKEYSYGGPGVTTLYSNIGWTKVQNSNLNDKSHLKSPASTYIDKSKNCQGPKTYHFNGQM